MSLLAHAARGPVRSRPVPLVECGHPVDGCLGHVHRSQRSGYRTALVRLAERPLLVISAVIAGLVVTLPGSPVALVGVAGAWLALGAPALLWYAVATWFVSTRDGRALLAVGLTVLTDLVVALLVNTTLPLVGVDRPLTRPPLAIASALAVVVLTTIAPIADRSAPSVPAMAPGALPVAGVGAAAMVLAVAGPTRLNNGLGGTVSVLALLVVAGLLVLLFVRRGRYPNAVLGAGLYLAAAALLLLTSLRGWYVSGHDVQLEFEVFQLTSVADHWSIAAFRDPYNACLSVTVLPALLTRLTGISDTYVFKAVLPLLFALTPVLVYRSVRNVASQFVALLSAVYFMAFPTFFTDMTFMARQEVAFLLLGCVMLVLTDGARPLRRRRTLVTVLVLGIVLSHYSTTYVVLATFAVALAIDLGRRLWRRVRPGVRPAGSFMTWSMLLVGCVAAFLWAGPLTDTGNQAGITFTATVDQLLGRTAASGSSDTAYSLFGGAKVSPAERLRDYTAETEKSTASDRAAGEYLPLPTVDRYPVAATDPSPMPMTAIGDGLQRLGVNVTAANGLARRASAGLLQLLLLLGLVGATLLRRGTFRPTQDQIRLSVGALTVMGVLTVLPELSVDYGVLRAFQQGLIFFAPFIAAASLWIFGWTRRKAPARIAFGLVLLLFLDLTGVVPKVLGGYPAQLHLSNDGQYYDIYYVHPEERAALGWLEQHHAAGNPGDPRAGIRQLIAQRVDNTTYPTLIGTGDYVFLGWTTVRKGESTVFYRGDLVPYRYPFGLLDATKNKIYSSDGAEIYR